MTQKDNLTKQPQNEASLAIPMLIGAGIAFILISIFLFSVNNPEPAWGRFWMVRPLIMVPLAGAMGGVFYYFMNYLSSTKGFNKTVAILLSFIVYLIGLWLGSVLGLDGTLWD